MDRQKKYAILLFILIGVIVSTAFPKPLSKIIKITLMEKRVQDLSFHGLKLVFYVNIANSSSRPAYLARYDYRFEVNGSEYLRLHKDVDGALKIKPKGTTVISIPVVITYDNLFEAIGGIEVEDKATCYLSGGFTITDGRRKYERFPIAFSADFPILKQPEIEFLSFKINDLTIGGAEVELNVLFKNRNSFELLVDKLLYSIELEEISVSEGVVAGNKNVEGRGSKSFAFPMLFSFYEIGKEVYDILRKSSSHCYFSGEAEVMTAWGRVKIPFEKAAEVVFSRAS